MWTLLILFHLVFFWGIYTNPFQLATSELLSTFFPTWVWQGREWSKGRIPKYDCSFWLNAHAHPVVSTYYPLLILLSRILRFFTSSLDTFFRYFVLLIMVHFLWASIGWWLLLRVWYGPEVVLFGALTFTYLSYHVKQQPCIVYTLTWFPWMMYGLSLGNIPLSSIAIGMMLLAGYYPIAIYLLPLGFLLFPAHFLASLAIGLLIGSPQLIPFIKYLPKTIRKAQSKAVETGFWERSFYLGMAPIIVLGASKQWFLVALPVIFSLLAKKWLPRVHYRLWIVSAYALIWFSLEKLRSMPLQVIMALTVLQAFDLWWHNRQLIPTRPFCELYERPSRAFNTKLTKYLEKHLGNDRVSGLPYPLFTGLINNFKTLGYSGGMQLKLMAKWRGDSDPNGSGNHDWFRTNKDSESLDISRIRFAFTRSSIDWERTSIPNLYRNPRLSGSSG